MISGRTLMYGVIVIFTGVFVLVAGAFLLPWRNINWGTITTSYPETITVTGTAKTSQKTRTARFNVGVNSVNDNKQTAVSEVNSKIEAIISSLVTFGIPKSDIKTQNLNVYQNEEQYWEEGRSKSRPGQWRVSNNIDIVLKNGDQATDLSNLLAKSGANNISGPNFGFEDTSEMENNLLGSAIDDAWKKAEIIARQNNKQIVKVASVAEGLIASTYPPRYEGLGGGGGGGGYLEPGSGTVSKSVSVVFIVR